MDHRSKAAKYIIMLAHSPEMGREAAKQVKTKNDWPVEQVIILPPAMKICLIEFVKLFDCREGAML